MLRNFIQLLAFAFVLSLALASPADEKKLDAKSVVEAQKLRMEARLAAERGDFATATDNIAKAADLVGESRTARKARSLAPQPQPAGGSPFANFQELIQLIVDQTINADGDNWSTSVGGNGTTGTISIASNGVLFGINALANAIAIDNSMSRLNRAADFAKSANHNLDVRANAELRMVSLPRLDREVRKLLAEGRAIPEDIRTIAGISQIKYLFVFPETQDVVIAGPASDWRMDADGRAISTMNQRPTLNLDDLVTLTRTFSPGGAQFFMCTINPKKDQIAAVHDFVDKNRNSLDKRTVKNFTSQLEQQLGLQDVIVQGVRHDSRIASVIVETDYRMKEIGIGKRKGPLGMKSYFELLTRSEQRGSGSMDALRWWMAVGYNGINMSPNGEVFEFAGNSIQCLSENQLVAQDGSRQSTGQADRANAEFAELFTKHLPELAAQDPAFADLQNIFDLALVSALVHTNGLAQQAGWKTDSFASESGFHTQTMDVPEELMTAAAYKVYSGGSIVIQVAGGVRVDVGSLIKDTSKLNTVEELASQSPVATPIGQQNNRWWWDSRVAPAGDGVGSELK